MKEDEASAAILPLRGRACEAVEALAEDAALPNEEARLVDRARSGDRAAMGELHRRYARMIHAIMLARVPPRDADDLAQDVFVQAITRLHTLREVAAFGGWLASIARNAATDHLRRKRPVERLDERRAGTPAAAPVALRAKEVLTVILRLPEAYREVLLMRLLEGMTGPEIATRAGLTPGSVRVNLHRGMKLLRAELGVDSEAAEVTA